MFSLLKATVYTCIVFAAQRYFMCNHLYKCSICLDSEESETNFIASVYSASNNFMTFVNICTLKISPQATLEIVYWTFSIVWEADNVFNSLSLLAFVFVVPLIEVQLLRRWSMMSYNRFSTTDTAKFTSISPMWGLEKVKNWSTVSSRPYEVQKATKPGSTRICAAEMAVRYAALSACRKVHPWR